MPDQLSGILNVDKPAGLTSHDVVARVRRITGQRSVGHAGTLDPLASGVLVVLLGRATSLSAYAMASRKTYAAEIVFGVATETDDAEGPICKRATVPGSSEAGMRQALEPLTGEVMQTPPRYSALKSAGQPAHRRARRGERVQPEPRPVTIHRLQVVSWVSPRLRVVVETGPGVYIRSIAREAGEALASAAYLHTLVRTSSGRFRLSTLQSP